MNAPQVLATLHPPPGAPAAAWAARITACWRATVEGVLEVGRLLAASKDTLEHGAFEAMIASDLPFSASTARRLMAIGADERLSNRAHVHALPNSWGTLYELTKLPDDKFEEAIADGTIRPDIERAEVAAIRKAIRNEPEQKAYQARVDAGCTLADLHALADSGAKFGTILGDPNWQYETWSEKGKDRSPDQHYKTDPLKPIKELPVARLADKNCILHLWCMDWLLPGALEVIDAWGFKFINVGFVWTKAGFMGLGHWTRNGAELCLLATKGHPVRRSQGVRQVIDAPIGKHSEKPAEIHKRVMALTGGPYLELYARAERDGWTTWGNEIPRTSFLREVTSDRGVERPPAAEVVTQKPVTQNNLQHESDGSDQYEDIPAFLRRPQLDSVPVVSPRSPELVDAGDGG